MACRFVQVSAGVCRGLSGCGLDVHSELLGAVGAAPRFVLIAVRACALRLAMPGGPDSAEDGLNQVGKCPLLCSAASDDLIEFYPNLLLRC